MRLSVSVALLVAGCEVIAGADRIGDAIDDHSRRDLISISAVPPIAVGATHQVEVEHVNLPTTPRIEQADIDGPFEILDTDSGHVEVHALGPGGGRLTAISSNDELATVRLEAVDPQRMTISPVCPEGAALMVPPETRFQIAYELFAMDDMDEVALVGTIEPVLLDNPLTFLRTDPAVATFITPAEAGTFSVTSALDRESGFELTVFDPSGLTLEIQERRIVGSAANFPQQYEFEAVQLAAGQRVCIPFDTDYVWTSDTPSVCLLRDGADAVAEARTDARVFVQVAEPGLCRLRAYADAPRTPDAAIERVFARMD